MDTDERFNQYEDEYLKFDCIENPRSRRPDLHAFLLLDELFPGPRNMVHDAVHDAIYLDIDADKCSRLTDEQVMELIRCGVLCDDETGSLMMCV